MKNSIILITTAFGYHQVRPPFLIDMKLFLYTGNYRDACGLLDLLTIPIPDVCMLFSRKQKHALGTQALIFSLVFVHKTVTIAFLRYHDFQTRRSDNFADNFAEKTMENYI